MIPTASAHGAAQAEIVVGTNHHSNDAHEQAHPALLAFILLPSLILMVAMVGLIVRVAIHFADKKA